MKKIRIGVVGTGHLGCYHLQKYRKISEGPTPFQECRITGIADTVLENAQKAADGCDCEIFTDYRKLLGKVDAVSIAVPTAFHYEVASFFLKAGVDILLEKPISTTLQEADELLALAEANQLILQIGFVERFNPAIAALENVIGKPLFVESHRLHPFFERGTDVDVILDLMVHDLDIITHFVGSPVSVVDAVGVSVLSDKVDIANARLVFASGCVANITASRVTGKLLQKTRFFGPEGYHALDFSKRTLVSLKRRQNADGKTEILENPVTIKPEDPLEEEIKAFVRSVTHRTPPLVSGKEGRDVLELALRINGAIEKSRANAPFLKDLSP
jgi:predicted dehydrogenase